MKDWDFPKLFSVREGTYVPFLVWFEAPIKNILQDQDGILGNPWALAKLSEDRIGARETPARRYIVVT